MYLKTKRLTVAAVMTALTVVFMYISSVIPSGRLTFAALACMCTTVVVAETGPGYALISYFASSVLSVLFAPVIGWLYAGLLGWYPSAKCLIERLRSVYLQWAVKLAAFAVPLAALILFVEGLTGFVFPKFNGVKAVYIAAGAAAMIVFDIVLSKFIQYYCGFLRPKFIKNR